MKSLENNGVISYAESIEVREPFAAGSTGNPDRESSIGVHTDRCLCRSMRESTSEEGSCSTQISHL